MNSKMQLAVLALLSTALLLTGAKKMPKETHDGLVYVEDADTQLAYVFAKPGADLSRYKSAKVDLVEVRFKKDYTSRGSVTARGAGGSPGRREMTASDRERFSELFEGIFKEALSKSGLDVVDTAGPDTLEIDAAVVDLYINAPSGTATGQMYTVSRNRGEMTMIAELRDSETGELLVRVVDEQVDPERGIGQIAISDSPYWNAAASGFTYWAQHLAKGIAHARTLPPYEP